MQKIIDLIEAAYCLEGDASATQLKTAPTEPLLFRVSGSSTCEHAGDVANLRSQVQGLVGQSLTEAGIQYTITSATCSISQPEQNEENEDGDGESSVGIDGKVTVTQTGSANSN